MLGMEPWLNTTTGCTYPLTSPAQLRNFKQPMDSLLVETPKIKLRNKPLELDVKYLKQNVGDFGNFAYGNMTVNYKIFIFNTIKF